MKLRLPKPRLGLRGLAFLVLAIAIVLWAGASLWSPTRVLSARLRPGQPAYVRREAAMSLGSNIPPWEIDRAISVLIGTLADPNPQVRVSAIAGLATHGPRASRAVPRLIALLKDADYGVRCSAAAALGLMVAPDGPERPAAVSALRRVLDDPRLDVRLSVAEALIKLGDAPSAAAPLVDAMAESDRTTYRSYARMILGRMGAGKQAILPAFFALTRSGDPRRRETALQLLMDHAGTEDVESALRRAARDADPVVRAWAAAKMDRLGLAPRGRSQGAE